MFGVPRRNNCNGSFIFNVCRLSTKLLRTECVSFVGVHRAFLFCSFVSFLWMGAGQFRPLCFSSFLLYSMLSFVSFWSKWCFFVNCFFALGPNGVVLAAWVAL